MGKGSSGCRLRGRMLGPTCIEFQRPPGRGEEGLVADASNPGRPNIMEHVFGFPKFLQKA